MKLAFCLFKYFPYGGLQRDLRAIINACLARGHVVDIYTLEWQGEPLPNVKIHVLPRKGWTNHRCYWNFSNYIVTHLKKQGYDAIVGFNKVAGLDVYYAADPCFLQVANTLKHPLYRFVPRFRCFAALEKTIFAPMAQTQILALADKQIEDFYQYYHTPKQRFHLLPPWLNADRFPPEDTATIRANVRQQFQLSDTDNLILFVGSGFKTKGLDRALLALASLPTELKEKTQLFVIGHDKTTKFNKLAQQLNVTSNLHFLGGRNDIPAFMFSADLLLHPAYAENTGNVLLEAIVAGLPVLTTQACGFANHVTQAQAGIVLPLPFEQTQLNQTLITMLTDKTMRETMRQHGLTYLQQSQVTGLPDLAADIIEAAAVQNKNTSLQAQSYFVYPELQSLIRGHDAFSTVMQLSGKVYRELDGRKTLSFMHNGNRYFAKIHSGVGWQEIFKSLTQLKLPTISAKNEYVAIKAFERCQIDTTPVLGFGLQGKNPAKVKSFLITKALENTISLEDLTRHWRIVKPDFKVKQRLLTKVANIAKIMHCNGMNHRDFYLCHFLLDQSVWLDQQQIKLYVIDLHRAQIRKRVPLRWQVKDLGSLYYSALDIGLTKRDIFRFIRSYTAMPLRTALQDTKLWDKIVHRTYQLTGRSFRFDIN